jgi:hypothetical protein
VTVRRRTANVLLAGLGVLAGCTDAHHPTGAARTANSTMSAAAAVTYRGGVVPATDTRPGPQNVPQPNLAGGTGGLYVDPCGSAHSPLRGQIQLRNIANEVQGLLSVTQQGPGVCELRPDPSSLQLLDRHGRVLGVRFVPRPGPLVNPPSYPRILLNHERSGTLTVSWPGSWCGPAPTTLRMLGGGISESLPIPNVDLPVTGGPPRCVGNQLAKLSPPTIEVSPPGGPDGPPPGPPAGWAPLRLRLTMSTRHYAQGVDNRRTAVLTIVNPTGSPIPLEPCPAWGGYAVGLSYTNPRSNIADGTRYLGLGGLLNCPAGPAAIPAHGSVPYAITLDLQTAGMRLGRLAVRVAIAGVPTTVPVTLSPTA